MAGDVSSASTSSKLERDESEDTDSVSLEIYRRARFLARRFPKNELDSLENIQKHWQSEGNYAYAAKDFYRLHEIWLANTLKELKEGCNKVALGLFVRADAPGTRASGKYVPVAAVILGQRRLERNEIELKSLIVDAKLAGIVLGKRRSAAAKLAKAALLHYVEFFCALRGFQELEIELPADEHRQVSFLLGHGFSLQTTESKRRVDSRFYKLARSITPLYGGDPADPLAIARWLVYTYLTADPINETGDLIPLTLDHSPVGRRSNGKKLQSTFGSTEVIRVSSFRLTLFPSRLAAARAQGRATSFVVPDRKLNVIRESLSISASIAVAPPSRILDLPDTKSLFEDSQLRLAFSTEHNSETLAQHLGPSWKVIGRDKLTDFLGSLSTFALNRIQQSEFGGLLIDLDISFAEDVQQMSDPWLYFCPNSFGKNLNSPDGRTQYALFCGRGDSPESRFGGAVIWGYAVIKHVPALSPQAAKKECDKGRSLIKFEQINQVVIGFRGGFYSEAHPQHDRGFFPLELVNACVLEKPLSLEEFVYEGWCSKDVELQLRDYERACLRLTTRAGVELPSEKQVRKERLLFPDDSIQRTSRAIFRVEYQTRTFYLDWETCELFGKRCAELPKKALEANRACDVFLSYRRQDEPAMVGRVFDRLRLKLRMHKPVIFYDRDGKESLQGGDNISPELIQRIKQCKVFVLFVGKQWAGVHTKVGPGKPLSRLNERGDHLRAEIEEALNRLARKEKLRFIIVRINGASFPEVRHMKSVKKLRDQGLLQLDISDDSFEHGVPKIVKAITAGLETKTGKR